MYALSSASLMDLCIIAVGQTKEAATDAIRHTGFQSDIQVQYIDIFVPRDSTIGIT
jgi:hypothetical protein